MELVNVVATVTLSTPICLESIHQRIKGTAFSTGGAVSLVIGVVAILLLIAIYDAARG